MRRRGKARKAGEARIQRLRDAGRKVHAFEMSSVPRAKPREAPVVVKRAVLRETSYDAAGKFAAFLTFSA